MFLNGRVLRQRDNARPTMSIATRALDLTQRNANRRLRVARLNAQIQIDNRAARVAIDNKSMVFGN